VHNSLLLYKVGRPTPVHFKIKFLNQIPKSKIDKIHKKRAITWRIFCCTFYWNFSSEQKVVIRKPISNLSDFLYFLKITFKFQRFQKTNFQKSTKNLISSKSVFLSQFFVPMRYSNKKYGKRFAMNCAFFNGFVVNFRFRNLVEKVNFEMFRSGPGNRTINRTICRVGQAPQGFRRSSLPLKHCSKQTTFYYVRVECLSLNLCFSFSWSDSNMEFLEFLSDYDSHCYSGARCYRYVVLIPRAGHPLSPTGCRTSVIRHCKDGSHRQIRNTFA
jgi:hypothetical protein